MRIKVVKPVLIVISSICFLFIGFLAGKQAAWQGHPEYQLVSEAKQYLRENYLYQLPQMIELERGMIDGMMLSIDDPYSLYLPPVNQELEAVELAGEYGGIGASIKLDDAGMLRLYPYPGSPAEANGIIAGDILIRVNDLKIDPEIELDTVLAEILGPEGSIVEMEIQSTLIDSDRYTVEITRAQFLIPSVERYFSDHDQRIGIIKINVFTGRTSSEVIDAFDYIQMKAPEGIVLDLRGNRGGLFSAAIEVSDLLINDCIIAVERSSSSDNNEYIAGAASIEWHEPLIILIDHNTASAAEIVAAALNECRSTPLLGSTTYGKGSVQSIFQLSDGSSLHVTTGEWLTGSSVSIDGMGLTPTVHIENDGSHTDVVMQHAIEMLTGEAQAE